MTTGLTLKRGRGKVFPGANWKLVGDAGWAEHRLYVPSRREPLVGTRLIDGVEHAVFRCLDDEYMAQPVEVCRLPDPEDPTEVVSV
jgi:hypothetical protein